MQDAILLLLYIYQKAIIIAAIEEEKKKKLNFRLKKKEFIEKIWIYLICFFRVKDCLMPSVVHLRFVWKRSKNGIEKYRRRQISKLFMTFWRLRPINRVRIRSNSRLRLLHPLPLPHPLPIFNVVVFVTHLCKSEDRIHRMW